MTASQAIGMLFLSGFASLDRLAGLNVMLSRPFVVAGIIGYVFDNLHLCLFIGVIFEIMGMLEVPVGVSVANDDTFGGYAASLLAATGAASHNAVSLLFCVCAVVVMMYPVTLSDKYCRSFNGWLIAQSIKNSRDDFESRLISYGLAVSFIRGVIIYNAAAAVIWVFLYFIDKIHNTSYSPYISLILLAVFLGGYLVRFFFVGAFFKVGLLTAGIMAGWFLL